MKYIALRCIHSISRPPYYIGVVFCSMLFFCCNNNGSKFKSETLQLSDFEEYTEVELNICFSCKTIGEAEIYEEKFGSEKLELEAWELERLFDNSLNPYGLPFSYYGRDSIPDPSVFDNVFVCFKRPPFSGQEFNEYVLYKLSYGSEMKGTSEHPINEIWTTYHLGEDVFGYEPRDFVMNGITEEYSLTKTRKMESAHFRNTYHSVIKSFFEALGADYVKTERKYLTDDFYFDSYYLIETDTLLMEEEWMHKFINTEYVFWRGEYIPLGSIIPNTHAPTAFYQVRGARNGSNKFEINVSDLSFTVVYWHLSDSFYEK